MDAQTNQAAAYNQTQQLITEVASTALMEYAKRPGHQVAQFDAKMHAEGLPKRMPLPAWATPEVCARLQLIWVRKSSTPEDVLAAMPKC